MGDIPVDKVIGIDIVIRVVRNTTPNAVVWLILFHKECLI